MALASGWKGSTQRLILNQLKAYNRIYNEIVSDKPYEMHDGSKFIMHENGKVRYIQSLSPKDVLMQHALTNYILIPILTRYLIHDNGASIQNKGLSFTRKRFDLQLHKFYRNHGRDGYVLQIDFRKYFDNIQHEKLLNELKRHLKDQELLDLIRDILSYYEVDVSYSDDEDIIDQVFEFLEYIKIPKEFLTGKRFMKKSLGIGSPVSQIFGIYFPYRIDQFCKTILGLKYYSAYMDDRVILTKSMDEILLILEAIRTIAIDLGIHMHKKKIKIIPLNKSFIFLKTKYVLTKTGKIIHKIPKDNVVRERRKLKKLAKIVVREDLSESLYIDQYKSWRGDKAWYDSHESIKEIDKIYKEGLSWIRLNRK